MEEYIKSLFYDVDAYGKGIQVILAAMKDRFFITIDQDWSEKLTSIPSCARSKREAFPMSSGMMAR